MGSSDLLRILLRVGVFLALHPVIPSDREHHVQVSLIKMPHKMSHKSQKMSHKNQPQHCEVPFTIVKELGFAERGGLFIFDERATNFLKRQNFPESIVISHNKGLTAVGMKYTKEGAQLNGKHWKNLIANLNLKRGQLMKFVNKTGISVDEDGDLPKGDDHQWRVIENDPAGLIDLEVAVRLWFTVYHLKNGCYKLYPFSN